MSDTPKQPAMRDMLPQYRTACKNRIEAERERVQNLVHDVLKISETPEEKDISDDITTGISVKSFLKS